MSKSTVAVVLTSPARLAPWGDDAWRFTGAMQIVADGPDWLHSRWTVPGLDSPEDPTTFDSMILRDIPSERAADIAVMALALLQVPGWNSLESWWTNTEGRGALHAQLAQVAATVTNEFKLAVVETEKGAVPDSVVDALVQFGFEVVRYGVAT